MLLSIVLGVSPETSPLKLYLFWSVLLFLIFGWEMIW